VALLDVDRFKQVNDTHGHAAGDALLAAFAQCLRTAVRATDFVARLAGDEFVLVLEGLHRAEECDEVAAKVVAAVRRLGIEVGGARIGCTTSVGLVFLPPERSCAAQRLVAQADESLYATKECGRDGFTRRLAECDRPANRLVGSG